MIRKTLSLSALALLCCAGAWAQAAAGFGAVTGAVVDYYGDGIPDVRVLLSNPQMGVQRTFMTTDDGVFNIVALPPGSGYTLKMTRKGFADWETSAIEVSVGQALNFKITLETAAEAKDAPALGFLLMADNTKTGLSDVVTRQQVEALPTAGRNVGYLLALTPPVPAANISGSARLGQPKNPTVLLDGNAVNNSFYVGPKVPRMIAEGAVQEFQTLSTGYSPQFGYTMGGIVNLVTRSGSNAYHGAVYDFFRNQSLNAADRYAPGFNPPQHEHHGGASLGGPILKDKLFFFTNFELLDGHGAGLNRITNPLIADPSGSFVSMANCQATASQCAAVANFIQPQMNVTVPNSVHSDTGFARIDYRRGARNSFTLSMDAQKYYSKNGAQTAAVAPDNSLLATNGNIREDSRYLRLSWISAPTPHTVNEMHAGWSRDEFTGYPNSQYSPSTGQLGISVAGTQIGGTSAFPYTYPDERRRQFSENFSVANNNHSVQFGIDIARNHYYVNQINDAGTYYYPTLTAFAQDFSGITVGRKTYSSFEQQFHYPIRIFPMTQMGAYLQDNWRILPRITLDYGIRWERPFLPKAPASNTPYYLTGKIPAPNIGAQPRIGVAVAATDKTVIRASYGVYYAPYSGQALDALMLGNNALLTSITSVPKQTGAAVFPNVYSWPGAVPSGSNNFMYSNTKLRLPYTHQTALAIEHTFGQNTSLTLTAVNSRGRKLWTAKDLNLADPTTTGAYTIYNSAGQTTGSFVTPMFTAKTDAFSAHVYELQNGASSSYNALTAQLRRRMSRSLSVQAAYTWSHAIDTTGNALGGFVGANMYNGNATFDRGSSATDQRHKAAINWVWQPQVGSGVLPAVRYIVNGWQVSGIAKLASGLPETPVVMVVGQQFSSGNMLYTSSLNGSGGWNRVPFLPVSDLRTQSEYNVDARLTRIIPFGERVHAELMFEAFNVFNTQRDTSLNTIAYVATAGVLRPAPGYGEGNASWGWIDGTNARRCEVAFRVVF